VILKRREFESFGSQVAGRLPLASVLRLISAFAFAFAFALLLLGSGS
jgi:hypothetical protein